jgi:hypothetical protein
MITSKSPRGESILNSEGKGRGEHVEKRWATGVGFKGKRRVFDNDDDMEVRTRRDKEIAEGSFCIGLPVELHDPHQSRNAFCLIECNGLSWVRLPRMFWDCGVVDLKCHESRHQ